MHKSIIKFYIFETVRLPLWKENVDQVKFTKGVDKCCASKCIRTSQKQTLIYHQ